MGLISVNDRGFLYGDTLFETIPRYLGRIPFLTEHLERLAASLKAFRYPDFDYASVILDSLQKILEVAQDRNGIFRVTVSRGELDAEGLAFSKSAKPNILVTFKPSPVSDPLKPKSTYAVLVSGFEHISPACLPTRHKHGNYLNSLFALDEARASGCDEALLSDRNGFLVEGAKSSLFCVRSEGVLTPPLHQGPLEGITRKVLLRLSDRIGIPILETPISLSSLPEFQELFVTNSIMGVQPIHTVIRNSIPVFKSARSSVVDRFIEAYANEVMSLAPWTY